MCYKINAVIEGAGEEQRVALAVVNHPSFYIDIREKDYKGEFGYDRMLPEYINAEEKVPHVDGKERKAPICQTIPELEAIYQATRFFENQAETYYSPWIALFPNSVEYKLQLTHRELSGQILPKTQIEFRCTSPDIEIQQTKLNNSQKPMRLEYKNKMEIKIRCVGEIAEEDLAVELWAILPSDKYPDVKPFQVGQLFIQANNIRRQVNVLFVHAVFSSECQVALNKKYERAGDKSLEHLFNTNSFNQALILCRIMGYESFDLRTIPGGNDFIARYALNNPVKHVDKNGNAQENTSLNIESVSSFGGSKPELREVTTNNIDNGNYLDFKREMFQLLRQSSIYQQNEGAINEGNLKVFLLINIAVQECENNLIARYNDHRFTSGEATHNGAFAQIQCANLSKGFDFNSTIVHELGHMLGLQHPWDRIPRFHRGYTDYFMDYSNNILGTKNERYKIPLRFAKPDWDILRNAVR
jgi:hypothetical protein